MVCWSRTCGVNVGDGGSEIPETTAAYDDGLIGRDMVSRGQRAKTMGMCRLAYVVRFAEVGRTFEYS